jgi:hypothetical protein
MGSTLLQKKFANEITMLTIRNITDTFHRQSPTLFPKKDFRITYYSNYNLRVVLSKTKDVIDKHDRSGIYKLQRNDCKIGYVGQTGRSIKVKTEEHKRHIRNGDFDKYQFAKHLWESDHRSDFVPEILHREKRREEWTA